MMMMKVSMNYSLGEDERQRDGLKHFVLSESSRNTAAMFTIISIIALDMRWQVIKSERHVLLGKLVHTLDCQTGDGCYFESQLISYLFIMGFHIC